MSIGPHLISIPCPINSNSLINFTCQASTISIIPFLNYFTHTWQSIIYIKHIKHTQTITNHPRTTKQPNHALSRPIPRSGWRVSLKRDSLAQARQSRSSEPPSPRWRLEKETRTNAGSHLGESDSPGRDYQFSPWSHLQQMYLSTQPIT